MGRDRNGAHDEKTVSSGKVEEGDEASPSKKKVSEKMRENSESDSDDQKKYSKSRRKKRESSGSEEEDERRRSRSDRRKRKSRGRYRSDEDSETGSDSDDDDDESEYSRSASDEETESESESEEERRRRKKKERRRREKEEERERKRRKREKEKKRRKKEEKRKKKEKKKKEKKEKGKKGAVTDSWGKYGVIRETDMWNKRPEFTAWLAEVRQVNLESLANWEEKQMFKEFMEDHNTATFPSKKYYNLDAYHKHKMEKEMKRGIKKVMQKERTIFNDEEQRRLEMLQEREKKKEEQVQVLKLSMQSGMAQAMKEQAQLREEMAYQYKIGNFEAASAIQRRLDPDLAM